MKHTSDLRRARTRSIAACLRPPHTAPRTPSIGLMPNLAIGPSSYAIIVRSRARAPHPFERREPALLVWEEPPRRPTLHILGSPRGSPRLHREDASHRSLQPTLDPSTRISTDSRARSSRCKVRLRNEPRALAPCHPERGVGPPCGNPTPGGSALDGASPASDEPPASLLNLIKEEKSSARRQSFPGGALSAAPRAGDPASDAPCRAPRSPIAERSRSTRTASTALASTRAASPIRGAFHRQVLPSPLSR